eukprot:1188948-Rhodomonas_salina.1
MPAISTQTLRTRPRRPGLTLSWTAAVWTNTTRLRREARACVRRVDANSTQTSTSTSVLFWNSREYRLWPVGFRRADRNATCVPATGLL